MTPLFLSLHLLAATPTRPALHLMDSSERISLAQLEPSSGQPAQVGTMMPLRPLAHRMGTELGVGMVPPLLFHSGTTLVGLPLTLFGLLAEFGDNGSSTSGINSALLVTALALLVADFVISPIFTAYAVADRHGDRSGNSLAFAMLGAFAGELIGAVPSALFLAGHLNGTLDSPLAALAFIIGTIVLDALCTSGGAMLAYHAVAAPFADGSSSPAIPALTPPTAPPPSMNGMSSSPSGLPTMTSAMNFSFKF